MNIDYEFYNKNGYDYFILTKYFKVKKKTITNHISKIRKKYSTQQDWIFTNNLNIDGRIQTAISEECFLFMKEVDMVNQRNKTDLEISFFEKRIKLYEEKLGIEYKGLTYVSMNKSEMQKYFGKSISTIERAVRLVKNLDMISYDDIGRVIVNEKGIEKIEKEMFKKIYSKHLQEKLNYLKKIIQEDQTDV